MIKGAVAGNNPLIEFSVLDEEGSEFLLKAVVVDAGFTGCIALPKIVFSSLGLRCNDSHTGILADGQEVVVQTFPIKVVWHGKTVRVIGSQMDGGALVGMELLQGSRLTIDAVDGGQVLIEELGDASA